MIGIWIYLAVAFGGAWLVALPLWLSGKGLATPGATLIMIGMMFVPALAAWIASRVSPAPEGFTHATGLRPSRPFRQWWGYVIVAWLAPAGVITASLALAWALGVFHVDLIDFSGFAAQLKRLGANLPMPVRDLVFLQLGSMLVVPFVNAIPALGEEIGWRGFLLPRLCRFGQWPAAVLTGVAWGLWHAPLILLGYNYPGLVPAAALACMVVFCVLLSVLLSWLRLASGSIWPSAIAHGFINGSVGLGALVAAAGHPLHNVSTGILGWTGWIVMGVLIGVLALTRGFPVRRLQPSGTRRSHDRMAGGTPAAVARESDELTL